MSRSLAHLFVATAQRQTQLVLQLLKVGKLSLHIDQLFFQTAAHGCTRLQAIPSQIHEASDLAEFESQTLYAADKSQRLDVVLVVLTKAPFRPRRLRQQGVALVKANRVNAKTDLFRDDANLHYFGSSVEATPWSIVQSQAQFSKFGLVLAISSAIYKKDLLKDRVLRAADLTNPSDELIARLRRESERAIELHRKYPQAAAHKRNTSGTGAADWTAMARTPLFRSKRCKQLAILLSVRKSFNETRISRRRGKHFRSTVETPTIQRAISQLVRIVKAERVGISMMDIIVCGAIAPYNALLGGKLACLLLCSPEIVKYYAERYRRQVSVIASAMKGKRVQRDPKLVLLCTTSLYGKGSSQYNGIKVPAASLGGSPSQAIAYQELGTSEGFGSFHFSKETVRMTDALLGRSKNGRKVNSIFGEGSPNEENERGLGLTGLAQRSVTPARKQTNRVRYSARGELPFTPLRARGAAPIHHPPAQICLENFTPVQVLVQSVARKALRPT